MEKNRLGIISGVVLLMVIVYTVFTYNSIVNKEEAVKKSWGNLQVTYQRRLELLPNLVSVVKGTTEFEKQVLEQIAASRAKAGTVTGNSAEPTPSGFRQLEESQGELASSANKLIAVIEGYPDLKGTQNFLALQSQIEGTERRIKVARNDFNRDVATYNNLVRKFPSNIVSKVFGFHPKEGFSAEFNADKAPEVNFKTK